MTKFAFDELKCLKFFLMPRSVLALYASGRTTGIVVYSDYECTEIVPVYEGYSIRAACKKINFGKRDILDYLDENKYNETDILKLKDGMDLFFDKINICVEIWECILSVTKLYPDDERVRRDYLQNIVLSGMNTCYSGLSERIKDEMIKLVSNITDANVKVIAPPEREQSAWIGGSILGSLSTFKAMWITRAEYEGNGASVVEKCDNPILNIN
eukprot:UN03255